MSVIEFRPFRKLQDASHASVTNGQNHAAFQLVGCLRPAGCQFNPACSDRTISDCNHGYFQLEYINPQSADRYQHPNSSRPFA